MTFSDRQIRIWAQLLLFALVALALCLTSFYSYVLFHSLVEIYSIVIGCTICVLAWNSRNLIDHHYLLFLGIASFFSSQLDILHTLAYSGMNILADGGTNLATQFWLSGRFIQSLSLFIAPMFFVRRLNPYITIGIFGFTSALFFWTIMISNIFPIAYISGKGLTDFKITSEYAVIALMAASIPFLLMHKKRLDADVMRWLLSYIALAITAELCFTLYADAYARANMIGHLFRLAAYYCLYRAFIVTGIQRPYQLLLRDLSISKDTLHEANVKLETIVELRTLELKNINARMEAELVERKRIEDDLRTSEARYRVLLESVTNYIYTVIIKNGKPTDTIHGLGCIAATGYTPEEFIDNPGLWLSMVHAEDRDRVKEHADSALAGAALLPIEHRIIHKDGTVRWIKNTCVPRFNRKGTIIAYDGLIEDITDRKRLEEQLRQAQKMEAMGQISGGIAHDFNNILSAMISFCTIMQKKLPAGHASHNLVEQMMGLIERASALTSGLLAMGRKQVFNLKPVNLNDVIKTISKILIRVLGEDIRLSIHMSLDRPMIMADSSQIDQVMMNLATNARDAMPKGGRLTITTDIVDMDEEFIRTHGYGVMGRYSVISFEDTGAGMDYATREKIFEPFFTTKDIGKGTGLGLSIVYGIIRQHNGYINVYSEQDKGTTFKIYLPFPKEKIARSKASMTSSVTGGKETILLVEDDSTVRISTRMMLEDYGYKILEAINGDEAIEKFSTMNSEIDLVLMDLIMPGKKGKEAYDEMKLINPDMKIIFTSGYTSDILNSTSIENEGLVFISKPASPRILLEKIRTMLGKEPARYK